MRIRTILRALAVAISCLMCFRVAGDDSVNVPSTRDAVGSLADDFDDGSFNNSLWAYMPIGNSPTESSGKLYMPGPCAIKTKGGPTGSGYDFIITMDYFDLEWPASTDSNSHFGFWVENIKLQSDHQQPVSFDAYRWAGQDEISLWHKPEHG